MERGIAFFGVSLYKGLHARHAFANPACMEHEHEKARPRIHAHFGGPRKPVLNTWENAPLGRVLLPVQYKAIMASRKETTPENFLGFPKWRRLAVYAKKDLSKSKRCRLWLSFVWGCLFVPQPGASKGNPIGFTLPYRIPGIKPKLAKGRSDK
jgi:hypothetical protein